MKKLTIILGILILATTAFFLFQPQPIGTGTRTKMVYLDRENNFTATTTLQKGFVSTSTPTQAGQIVGLDEDGKLPAVDGSQLTGLSDADTNYVVIPSFSIRTAGGGRSGSVDQRAKLKEIEYKNISGRIKILWGARGNTSNNGSAQIYINGSPVGVNRTGLSTSNYNYDEEFNVNNGDLIQIYGSGNNTIIIDYFNLCYVKTIKTIADVVNL